MNVPSYLVVDDNAMNRRLVIAILDREGLPAREAATLHDARQELGRSLHSGVLLDIQLGGGEDGVAFASELRANPATAHLLIIAVTALAMSGDRERFLEAGFDGYISKPISVRTLVSEIRAIEEVKQRRRLGTDS